MADSDYIIYVDESGDHGLENIDQDYPVFVLSFCIVEKSGYASAIVPSLLDLKFRFFGHDMVVLHSHEIRKAKGEFSILVNRTVRERFMESMNEFMMRAEFVLVASVIKKNELLNQYVDPNNPYQIALLVCLERAYAFLRGIGQADRTTHIVFESRGKREDDQLELEFRRICDGDNHWGELPFKIRFAAKSVNSAGLQLADLTAQPIGRYIMNPEQENRAYEIIEPKFRRSPSGEIRGWGLKVFP